MTFTKEQLIKLGMAKLKNLRFAVTQTAFKDLLEDFELDIQLTEIALAALESSAGAEPARNPVLAYADSYRDMSRQGVKSIPIWSVITDLERNIAPLCCRPQSAPGHVQDDHYWQLSELYHAQEKRLFKMAQRIKGPSFDKYAYSPSQAIDVLETAIFGEKEDNGSACRAAMLQGGK